MRLIDADVLRVRLEGMMKAPWNAQSAPYCWAHAYEAMQEELDNAPTVEAEPVKHGRWIEDETTYAGTGAANWLCSECKRIGGTWWRDISPCKMYRYCPNCGARMDGEV